MAVIPDVTDMTIDVTGNIGTYASASTSGGTKRLAGQKDWTATITVLAQGGAPAFAKGATGTLKMYTISTTHFFSGTAIVESIGVNPGEIASGEAIEYVYSIGGTADLTYTGVSGTTPLSATVGADWT